MIADSCSDPTHGLTSIFCPPGRSTRPKCECLPAKEVPSLIELASTLCQCSPPTRAVEMLPRPPLAVASENPKPKIENGLFFLFLLWSLFFCSMSRRRTGFALFLFLRDHFRSCGCGFCFRRCSFFLHHRLQH